MAVLPLYADIMLWVKFKCSVTFSEFSQNTNNKIFVCFIYAHMRLAKNQVKNNQWVNGDEFHKAR